MRSCFAPLYEAEQHRGSVVLGMMLGAGRAPLVVVSFIQGHDLKQGRAVIQPELVRWCRC